MYSVEQSLHHTTQSDLSCCRLLTEHRCITACMLLLKQCAKAIVGLATSTSW